MTCPKCFQDNTTLIGDHYICNNPTCRMENGRKTQFKYVEDIKVEFPANQIFVNRRREEFYKKPYIILKNIGSNKV